MSNRDAAFRHRAAASSRVVQIPQREQRFIATFRSRLDCKWSKSSVVASSADVWTNFSTPQQEKAKLRAPRGPHIPEFLVKEENYAAKDFIEIGFVWKAIGARGEVFVRVCTSLQDYRVGLPGPRCENPVPSGICACQSYAVIGLSSAAAVVRSELLSVLVLDTESQHPWTVPVSYPQRARYRIYMF